MQGLTASQQKVLDYIKEAAPSGIPPTVREICAATGLRSTSTVHAHLKTLERMGYISRGAGLNRSIRIEGAMPTAQPPDSAHIAASAKGHSLVGGQVYGVALGKLHAVAGQVLLKPAGVFLGKAGF